DRDFDGVHGYVGRFGAEHHGVRTGKSPHCLAPRRTKFNTAAAAQHSSMPTHDYAFITALPCCVSRIPRHPERVRITLPRKMDYCLDVEIDDRVRCVTTVATRRRRLPLAAARGNRMRRHLRVRRPSWSGHGPRWR